jgi:hypothetical protein
MEHLTRLVSHHFGNSVLRSQVYITFTTAFWDGSPAGTPPAQTSSTAAGNEDSAVPATYHYPGFTLWMSPEYAKETNPQKWCQESVNMAALPSGCDHPSLLFYVFADTSYHLSKIIEEAPNQEAANVKILEFFEPYYSRLPGFDAQSPQCKPLGLLATNWAGDELAGYGSYCNFQVGSTSLDKDIEVMRDGMPDRAVWLAGEHTAPFVALGTVTGAYWSGEGVAEKVLNAFGLDQETS